MKLLLIDGHSILNRAYYGLPHLTNSKGKNTGAVYGFVNTMLSFLDSEKPDSLIVAFDCSAPTFRHEKYKDYKGQRKAMDPELKEQVPMIQELLKAMDITIVKKEGIEGDDILGTLSRLGEKEGMEVTILSGDRDILQLATDKTKIALPRTRKTGTTVEYYHADDIAESLHVTPTEFIDVKALMGDLSDNIPGVPGIGEKTAFAIIEKYHSIENAYEDWENIKPKRASTNLHQYYDQALMSKDLATIRLDCDLDVDINEARLGNIFTESAYKICKDWELERLLRYFGEKEPDFPDMEKGFSYDLTVSEIEEKLAGEKYFGFSALYAEEKGLSGIYISKGEETFSLKINEPGDGDRLLSDLISNGMTICAIDLKELLSIFPVLSDLRRKFGDEVFFDAGVAAYIIDPLLSDYPAELILKDITGESIRSYSECFGKKSLKDLIDEAYFDKKVKKDLDNYKMREACAALKTRPGLLKKLEETGMTKLYKKIELPLIFTLSDMEKTGMLMDRDDLISYGGELKEKRDELEKEIYKEAGREFNINSPKQLSTVLFEEMNIKGGKKTKTGYSTAADVLEKLKDDNPVINEILDYRKYQKLISTYIDGLKDLAGPDGRVHSKFQQKVTATGRISSTEPNLQNIPVRLELGKKIRKAFRPEKGFKYIDADYSQIELRVLAHMSGDENLIKAYHEGRDIHRSTAALVFHKPFDQVTDLERRNAKAVNFGIVYGISPFGLSKDIGTSVEEAAKYIEDYYKAFPGLKTYLDGLIESAKEKGYAETLFGRRRPVPELKSSNFMQRSFGERVARNSPIQGTAADIIKIAMVRVHDRLDKENLKSKLVLQVHDELLIEAYDEELEYVRQLLKEEMENAASLSVDLTVDISVGDNWYDVH